MTWAWALAQTTQPTGSGPGLSTLLLPWVLIIGLFYLLILRPRRVEEQKHRSMIGALKKNDRVVTIGGMLGTVVAVKDDEVTLKIDESTNTKVTFLRSAIKSVIAVAPGESKPS